MFAGGVFGGNLRYHVKVAEFVLCHVLVPDTAECHRCLHRSTVVVGY